MDQDLLGPLSDGDVRPLRGWLAGRGVDTEKLRGLPRWNTVRGERGEVTARRPPDRTADVVERLTAELPKVRQDRGGTALLLLYVLHEVEEAWESSYHFSLLWDTLRATRGHVPTWYGPLPAQERAAADAVLTAMHSVDHEIMAENAMITCRPESQAEESEKALRLAAEAAATACLAADFPALGQFLAEFAEEAETYYTGVARAACGTRDFLRAGTPLDEVIADLAAAESSDSLGSIYRSELRAHRFNLMRLNARRNDPWLRVDQGTLVYIYPFAVQGLTAEQVVDEVRSSGNAWTLAGFRNPTVQNSLDLTCFWDGSDSRGRRYDGAGIELPDVTIRGLDGVPLTTLQAQIRFSDLGNHYIRFEVGIVETPAYELYAMMFRGAPEHGFGQVGFDVPSPGPEPERWPRLSDLASRLAQDTGLELRRTHPRGTPLPPAGVDEGDGRWSVIRAVSRPGMYQLVLSVNAASTAVGPHGAGPFREVRESAEAMAAGGAGVLVNPVASHIASTADWIRYPTDVTTAAVPKGLDEELVVCTPNTTFVLGLGEANWLSNTRMAQAEFVSSLDGLLAGWVDELAGHYRRIRELHDRSLRVTDLGVVTVGELARFSKDLDDEKVRLHEFTVDARAVIAFIRSPSLVTSPVDARDIGILLQHSGFPRRVDELTAQLDEIANEQLDVTIDKLATKRVEKQRAKLEIFLAVIAAAGISGLVQVLQAGLDSNTAFAVIGDGVVLAGAMVFGIWVRRSGWSRHQ